MAVNLHANHFRFGIDELAENTHGWYANEDQNPAQGGIPLDTVFLLRINVQEIGGTAAANTDNTFEFRINGGSWAGLTTTSVGPRAVAAAALTNGGNCTQRLSGTGTFETSGAGQTEDGTSGGNANDIAASGCSETECGIIIDSADVAHGATIEFRLTSPDFTITNDVIPTIIVYEITSRTILDSLLMRDDVAASVWMPAQTYERIILSTPSLSDGVFRAVYPIRNTLDSVGVQDRMNQTRAISRDTSEPIGVSDVFQSRAEIARAVVDAWLTSDAVLADIAAAAGITRQVLESLALADTFPAWAILARSVTEASLTSDDKQSHIAVVRALADSMMNHDDQSSTTRLMRSIMLGVALTDTLSQISNRYASIAETFPLREAVVSVLSAIRGQFETVAMQDTNARVLHALRLLVESPLWIDTMSRAIVAPRSVSDALLTADQSSVARTLARLSAEVLPLIESEEQRTVFQRFISESVETQDRWLVAAQGIYLVTMLDTLPATDAARQWSSVLRQAVEALLASDSEAEHVIRPRSFSDSLLGADSMLRTVAASRTTEETVAGTDLASVVASLNRSLSEALLSSDAASSIAVLFRSLLDTLLSNDTWMRSIAQPTQQALLLEVMALIDHLDRIAYQQRDQNQVGGMSDSISVSITRPGTSLSGHLTHAGISAGIRTGDSAGARTGDSAGAR